MKVAGSDEAIANLMKWSSRDEWLPYREEVFADHLDPLAEMLDLTPEELVDRLGEAFDIVLGVILEDFFTERFGEDGELNIIDDYLKRRGWREKVPARRYLAAMRDSVMSLYEVVDLEPGRAMTVRDMLRGGDPVRVEEKLGSENTARWDRLAARLITVNNKPRFTGGMLMMPHQAATQLLQDLEETAKRLRSELRREAKKQGQNDEIALEDVRAALVDTVGPQSFTRAWLEDLLEAMDAPLPRMCNTDGDDILFSEVRFPLHGDVAEVAAAIDGIEDVERTTPDEAAWIWHGQGSPAQRMTRGPDDGHTLRSEDDQGRTCLGNIEIRDRTLLLSVNSRQRAERGRDLLAAHLGSLVGAPLIAHEDIERTLDGPSGPQASPADEIPPEVAAQIIRDYLDDHYRRTLDDPLPVLDGKTPRQAVKTKKGRGQVIEWLKYLENGEHRRAASQGQEPYDMTWMWRELKLEGER